MAKELPDYGMDEIAVQSFEAMGFAHPFPKGLVDTYKKFKLCRDKLTPGRISAEGFASIVMLASMAEASKKKQEKAEEKTDTKNLGSEGSTEG